MTKNEWVEVSRVINRDIRQYEEWRDDDGVFCDCDDFWAMSDGDNQCRYARDNPEYCPFCEEFWREADR